MSILLKLFNFYKYKRKPTVIFSKNYGSSQKLKILFFGTDTFSLPSLKVLHHEKKNTNSKISELGVVTSFKSPSNPVKYYASKNPDLPLYEWPVTPEICSQFTLGIIVSFGHLIPEKLILSFPLRIINVHASLLPRWRGAAPIIHAISHGDTKTGVSIMKIEPKKFDIGDVLYQSEIPIDPNIFMPQLHEQLAETGAILLLKTVHNSPECFQQFQPQNQQLATYAPKIKQSFCDVNWSLMTAKQIYDLYRSLYSYKNLTTKFQTLIIKLVKLQYQLNKSEDLLDRTKSPGCIEYSKIHKVLKVFGNDGDYIEIQLVKVEGKKVINAQDFNNGFLKKCNPEERYFK